MTDRAATSGSIRFAPFELVLEPEELRKEWDTRQGLWTGTSGPYCSGLGTWTTRHSGTLS